MLTTVLSHTPAAVRAPGLTRRRCAPPLRSQCAPRNPRGLQLPWHTAAAHRAGPVINALLCVQVSCVFEGVCVSAPQNPRGLQPPWHTAAEHRAGPVCICKCERLDNQIGVRMSGHSTITGTVTSASSRR